MSSDPESPDDSDAERAVSSVPLKTEDGDTVVIAQQNVGPGQQVGAGEFKRDEEASSHKSPERAAEEQDRLDDELDAERPDLTSADHRDDQRDDQRDDHAGDDRHE